MNETYAAVLISVAVFLIILCLASPLMQKAQAKATRLSSIKENISKKQKAKRRLEIQEIAKKLKERQNRREVYKFAPNNLNSRPKVARMLANAGWEITENTFAVIRIGSGAALAAAAFLVSGLFTEITADTKLTVIISALITGLLAPLYILKGVAGRRKTRLLNSMPTTMDLLSISTSAGLGFDAAIMKIAEHDNAPCIQELKLTLSDVQHGISKKEAYSAMAERCEIHEMKAFVNAILQADELGVSISAVLKDQAEMLREERRLRAEEKANKAPVKITIPLVLCIFPAIFAVLLAPAVVSIIDVFKTM